MNKRVKRGMALMLLGAAYLNNAYARDSSQSYPLNKPTEPNQAYPINKRERGEEDGGGFGALELGIVGLISVYVLRRVLRDKKQ